LELRVANASATRVWICRGRLIMSWPIPQQLPRMWPPRWRRRVRNRKSFGCCSAERIRPMSLAQSHRPRSQPVGTWGAWPWTAPWLSSSGSPSAWRRVGEGGHRRACGRQARRPYHRSGCHCHCRPRRQGGAGQPPPHHAAEGPRFERPPCRPGTSPGSARLPLNRDSSLPSSPSV
jgi:hypothetical protein